MRRAALAAACVAACTTPAQAATVAIRGIDATRIPSVRLTVTVDGIARDRAPAFALRENGSAVTRLQVGLPSSRTAIALAIDTSRSMRGRPLHDALAAASGFLRRMRPTDTVALVGFGHAAQVFQGLTSDQEALQQTLAELQVDAVQGTALEDGVVAGSHELSSAPADARRVLIVLTDGRDTSSRATAGDAEQAAVRGQVSAYTIALHSTDYAPGVLRALAAATGGSFRDANAGGLRDVYAQVADELARTYVLRYVSRASGRVAVSVSAGGTVARADYLGGSTPTVSAGHGLVPERVTRAWWSAPALALCVFVLLLSCLLMVFRPRPRRSLQKRLEAYAEFARRRSERRDEPRTSPLTRVARTTEKVMGGFKLWQRVGAAIERADLPLRTGELFYIMLGCALVAALPIGLAGAPAPATGSALVLGFLAPALVVRLKARKRAGAFDAQLPDTLTAMAASLKAGHAFTQAMDTVIREGAEPTSKEFGRVASETRLGRSSDDAMEIMAKRIGSADFEFVVMSVAIQRQVGGSLAELLDQVADTVRSRQQFRRKVKALTAMGRMSAYALISLPILMGLGITAVNASYMAPLYFTALGHFLIGAAIVSIAFGALILKKIIAFKV